MNDKNSDNHHSTGPDALGQAAILLLESLVHSIIENEVLTVAQAVESVNVAIEVIIDKESGADKPLRTSQTSINLLQDISASLSFDLDRQVQRGTSS